MIKICCIFRLAPYFCVYIYHFQQVVIISLFTFVLYVYIFVRKITRYWHHITFINTYLQMNYIHRHFTLKFYRNWLGINYSKILKTHSALLMTSTIGYYKKLLLSWHENYNSHLESVHINWNNKFVNLIDKLHSKYQLVSYYQNVDWIIFAETDFRRDGLDIWKTKIISQENGKQIAKSYKNS